MKKLDKNNIEDILALTPMQEGMLFHYLKEPQSEIYFEQLSLEISGKIDAELFEKAWNFVIETNEMLRVVFRWEKVENPVQIILKEHKLKPEVYDFSSRIGSEKKKKVEEIKLEDRKDTFDLREVPFRVILCKLEEDKYEMIISNFHIVYDGWSNGIILKEFFEAYICLSAGKKLVKPVKTKFKKLIEWNKNRDKDDLEKYWRRYLKGFDTQSELSIKRKRKETEITGTGHFRISIAEDLKRGLEGFVKEHKITLASLLYSVWGLLMQKYNNTDDVIFGTTVSGRNAKIPGIEEVVGLFINTPPLRIRTNSNEKTVDFLYRIDKELQMREAYETASLVNIKEYSEIDNKEELFDTIVVIENYPLDSRLMLKNTNLSVESYLMIERPHYDLNFIIDIFGGIDCVFIYNKGRFDEEDIERLSCYLRYVLGNVINNPGEKIADIEIISEQEKNKILFEFNNTAVDYPKDKTIHQLFEEQVVKTPDQVALSGSWYGPSRPLNKVIAGGRSEVERCFLTYKELNERANRLAWVLRARGVCCGDLVGLMPERTVEMPIGLLAILKTGAAYIPLGPEYPEDRCAYILEECRARILLTGDNRKISRGDIVNICLDSKNDKGEPANLPPAGAPTDLAYVIYTSGTTGNPKGVMIEHRSVINFVKGITDIIPFAPGDSILCLTTLAFDIFGLETLLPLLKGAKVIMGREEEQLSPAAIASAIEKEKITIFQVTPSRLQLIISDPEASQNLQLLKSLLVGGEAFPEILVENTRKITRGKIYNVYGPTETTIWSTVKDVTGGEPLNIGKPIANTRIYILNNKGLLQPRGVPGELYIAGDGLARGYFNNDKLTKEKFLPDPFTPGEKMYKTGDLGKWLFDGNIECLGRIDYQVKIRGFRIELGEIETQLSSHAGIKQSVVIVQKSENNETYLAAYIVSTTEIDITQLRKYLLQKLPDYMVPSYFIQLDKIPLTPSGKVDQKTLLKFGGHRPSLKTTYVVPESDTEKIIASIWKELLKLDKVGLNDNFFDLGGNSLSIIRLNSKLKEIFQRDIPLVALFNYPTISAQAKYFNGEENSLPAVTGAYGDETDAAAVQSRNAYGDIAVIGMAGRFPGAGHVDEFWDNLKNGKESITFFTDEELEALGVASELYDNPHYVKAKGELEDMESFDPQFFNYSAREARLMDPQLRLLHQCAWEALENAGYVPGSSNGAIGLYVGSLANTWWGQRLNRQIKSHSDLLAVGSLNDRDYLATRISYKLNLKGPAVTVQTACSTSLVAIDTACQALQGGRCHIALAGGISLTFQDRAGYLYEDGMVRSPDGHCRPFDAGAKGTAGGNGVGMVVLKPLKEAVADSDNIRAVIKGSAINNDGARKVGYTAPSVEGQVEVIRSALKAAGIEPESVTYLETHGTGTILGDPVEIEALKQAFNTDKKGFCALGAVKANIGHLDAAAGATGFIKTVLALEHRMIPPLVNFKSPNPQIDFENSPFYVNTQLKEWKNNIHPLRAGVSSFGIGGTNAHVILEEWPGNRNMEKKSGRREHQLVLLSAKTQSALEKMTLNLMEYLKKNPRINLGDVAYTLQVGRETFQHRRMAICSHIDEAIESLSGSGSCKLHTSQVEEGEPLLIFMFPGLGSQYVNMGRELYEKEPYFRREMDRCFKNLASLMDVDIREILYPEEIADSSLISQTEIAQVYIFIFEYALATLLMKWGIQPQLMIGYSFGEYAAACIAGVFSLEDALKLVVARGQLIKKTSKGAMMSVPLPREELRVLLTEDLSIAVDNGPSCVISGPGLAMDAFEVQMKKRRCICMRLPVTRAVHSKMMEPVLKEFKREFSRIRLNKPQIRYMSNVTGQLVKDSEAVDPDYWLTHLRETVCFADGMRELIKKPGALFIEVGPGQELSSLLVRHLGKDLEQPVLNLVRHPARDVSDVSFLLDKIGFLWLKGIQADWSGFYWGWEEMRRISLPTYPFEQERYWFEEDYPGSNAETLPPKLPAGQKRNIEDWFYIPSWKRSLLTSRDHDGLPGTFTWLVFVNECYFCELVRSGLVNVGHEVITISVGETFNKESDYSYTINPRKPEDYDILFRDMFSAGKNPQKIVHMWNLTGNRQEQKCIDIVSEAQYLGFYSLLYLAGAIGRQDIDGECQVTVISDNMQEVAGEERLCLEKVTLLGPVRVIPQEYSNINCRSIDILLPPPGSLAEEKLLNGLLRELRTKIMEPVVAYRGNHRLVQAFAPVRLDKSGEDSIRLRKAGVYLITGGFGGIGLTIARYLVKTVKAKLILVGRTALPTRYEWEKWLADHEEDNGVSRRIREVLELERLGGEIFTAAADVTDFDRMQEIIACALERFGSINGVIHAAGLPGDGVIQRKTWDMTETVLAPKIKGTLILDRLLRDEKPDFFILCSSINSFIGTFGQVDYTAANCFLNAFAYDKTSRDRTVCISINWSTWAEVGVGHRFDSKLADERNISPENEGILPSEGIDVFTRILNNNINNIIQVVVSTQDFIESVRRNKSSRSTELAALLEEAHSSKIAHSRPRLSSSYIAPGNQTEQLLTDMWIDFFGIDRIGVDDNFFELGATSLDLVQLNSRLKDKFGRKIPVEKMFTYPTITALAGYLDGDRKELSSIIDDKEMEWGEVLTEGKNRLMRRKMSFVENDIND